MSATAKRSRGQPSSFNEALAQQIFELSEGGATDAQIAKKIGVTVRTFHNWKHQHPDFFHSLKNAKAVADELVEISLYKRACGYSHREVKVFCYEGQIITHEVEKHYPPDTGAAAFWLKNRQPDRWRDAPKEPIGGLTLGKGMTVEEARKILSEDPINQPAKEAKVEDL